MKMTDLRKAAEMALEALEWNYGTDLENIENCMAWLDKMNATIPALRQALAQPEERGHCICGDPTLLGYVHFRTRPCIYYTAPPKREWHGLTDKELKVLCDEWQIIYGGYVRPFAETIEAKLKEKNGGQVQNT